MRVLCRGPRGQETHTGLMELMSRCQLGRVPSRSSWGPAILGSSPQGPPAALGSGPRHSTPCSATLSLTPPPAPPDQCPVVALGSPLGAQDTPPITGASTSSHPQSPLCRARPQITGSGVRTQNSLGVLFCLSPHLPHPRAPIPITAAGIWRRDLSLCRTPLHGLSSGARVTAVCRDRNDPKHFWSKKRKQALPRPCSIS